MTHAAAWHLPRFVWGHCCLVLVGGEAGEVVGDVLAAGAPIEGCGESRREVPAVAPAAVYLCESAVCPRASGEFSGKPAVKVGAFNVADVRWRS